MEALPEKLIRTIKQFKDLPPADWKKLTEVMHESELKKGDFFLHQGKICNHLGFLISGVMRVYHLANDKEYTSYFNFGNRNPFVSSYSSFVTRKPSQENIHALEDCQLVQISYNDLQQLYKESSAFQTLGRLIAEFNYTLAVERIYSLQHNTANERYSQLLDIYPNLINVVPHHYVASYLGVTPESLSRIRKELSR